MKELIKRTISGIVFCVILISCLFFWKHNPLPYIIVFSFIVCCMVYEYLHFTIGKGKVLLKLISITASVSIFLIPALLFTVMGGTQETCSSEVSEILPNSRMYYKAAMLFVAILVLCLFMIPLERLFSKENKGLEFAWSSLVYVAVPFATLNVVGFFGYNGWKIASLLILLWAGDVGAYCIGTALGQGAKGHKLMPSVSPKKSWEGVIGSLIFSVIAAVILRYFNLLLPEASYKACTLYALIVSIFAVMGDLVESQLKRRFEVKDSGNIMPGHGGLLDRFDSALFAFPAAAVFYLFYNYLVF